MSASAPSTKPEPPGERDDSLAQRTSAKAVSARTHDVEASERECCQVFFSLYAEAKLLSRAHGGVVVHHVLEDN
ncbi:MAG TPA: hypothetical protein PLG60_02310 [Acidimicrobiales bacterium]|nr:MAG: hypothetical protein B7X07_01955 [Actinobacteria bacterium 21-64-8]HQT99318.1 hypothetical protein [Acidimicrobiales bacterium]